MAQHDLGKQLKELRKNKKWTLEELSNKTNIPKVTLSRYENNLRRPVVDNLEILAKTFEVDIDYLLGDNNSRMNFIKNSIKVEYQKQIELLTKYGYETVGYPENNEENYRDIENRLFEGDSLNLKILDTDSLLEINNKIKKATEANTGAYYSSLVMAKVKAKHALINLIGLLDNEEELTIWDTSINANELKAKTLKLLEQFENIFQK